MPTQLRFASILPTGLLLAFSLALGSLSAAPTAKSPKSGGKPLTARENYEKHCVDCHGENGKSQTRLGRKSGAKDLTDKSAMAKLTDDEVFKTIKFGRKNAKGEEKMDAFADGLSDQEIRDLVGFVRGLAK